MVKQVVLKGRLDYDPEIQGNAYYMKINSIGSSALFLSRRSLAVSKLNLISGDKIKITIERV